VTRLFDPGPATKLTPRQARAYAAIKQAGYDGIDSDHLGAAVGARPDWCHSAGVEVGKALRRKGLVCQRRRDGRLVWTVAGKLARTDEGVIPY
jgi:hypothetical protein